MSNQENKTIPVNAQKLRGFMAEHRITVTEVAKVMHVSQPRVSQILADYRGGDKHLQRVRRALTEILERRDG